VIVGISTYGTTFTLANAAHHGLKATSTGPGKPGKYTQEPGTLAYYEVRRVIRDLTRSSAIAEGRATRLSVEILQLRIVIHLRRLQSTNDLEVHTSKVIAIAVSGLLLPCFYLAPFSST